MAGHKRTTEILFVQMNSKERGQPNEFNLHLQLSSERFKTEYCEAVPADGYNYNLTAGGTRGAVGLFQ